MFSRPLHMRHVPKGRRKHSTFILELHYGKTMLEANYQSFRIEHRHNRAADNSKQKLGSKLPLCKEKKIVISRIWKCLPSTLCWNLWLAKDKRIFKGQKPSIGTIIAKTWGQVSKIKCKWSIKYRSQYIVVRRKGLVQQSPH